MKISHVLLGLSLLGFSLGAAEMVKIPGGEFMMGGKAPDAKPHKVKVSPFMMDKFEVTQGDYRTVVGENPSRFKGDDLPVERVRWNDCIRYCNMRSAKEGLKPCYDLETGKCDFSADGYRLPTEAEWEFACRAGSAKDLSNKGGMRKIGDAAWLRKNSKETTHKVGSRQPNAFGLYDMYGNVAEWCNDFYDADYYAKSPAQDPKGPEAGKKRVLRGGSWQDREKKISSFMRMSDDPATADICQGYDTYGFRCVKRVSSGK
jgi:formylglycine-generating enzyme required for sulfatase activity